jgi:hypothetical protein
MRVIRRELKDEEVISAEIKCIRWTNNTRISGKQICLTMTV